AGSDPVDIEPGVYEVLLEPACVASMLDFLAYAGFNAKTHGEGRSFAHPGEKQFDSSVNLWDDATDARSLGVAFDAEGTPKRRVEITTGVKNLRFTQSFARALGPGKVVGVGDDARLARGHLGSLLGNSHIVPSLHLAAWNFTGGAKG